MANGDYKNNPLYSDITQLDHLSPAPVFQYFWNKESGRWEPQGEIDIKVDNLNLEIDLSSTNEILSGIADNVSNLSGFLSGINFNVSVDSDTTTHGLLSGISGALSNLDSNNADLETHRLLSGISSGLSDIHVDVEIDSDSETHRLLSGVSGELSRLKIDDTETHRLLSGVSGELSNIDIDDAETHRLLSGISGELSNIHVDVDIDSDSETHRLLSGVSGELSNINIDDSETHRLLSGVSGELSNINIDDSETHRLLSGVSGELSNLDIDIDDTETHRLLSGISGELSNIHIDVELDSDTKTHELLSGVISKLSNIGFSGEGVTIKRSDAQPYKKRTKTVNQKIEEDFILMEDIPDNLRYGTDSGSCYGTNKNLMDDVFGTYFENGRMNKSELEIAHPEYFIHSEYTPQDRCTESFSTFHTDTQFSLRQENVSASLINSYELEDYNDLYERGLMDHIVIFNESSYPIQFHTADRRLNKNEPVSPKNEDLIFIDSDMGVKIDNDEAGRVFIKRPHTISGYTVKYSIVYKVTGDNDVI